MGPVWFRVRGVIGRLLKSWTTFLRFIQSAQFMFQRNLAQNGWQNGAFGSGFSLAGRGVCVFEWVCVCVLVSNLIATASNFDFIYRDEAGNILGNNSFPPSNCLGWANFVISHCEYGGGVFWSWPSFSEIFTGLSARVGSMARKNSVNIATLVLSLMKEQYLPKRESLLVAATA